MHAHVQLKGSTIELLGGAPEGRDQVNKIVATWAGWSRRPSGAVYPPGGGRRVSVYFARCWESTIVPLLEQTQIELSWEQRESARTEDALPRYLRHYLKIGVEAAKVELDPPPSHHAPLEWHDEWARQPMPHQRQAIRALKCMGFRAILADDMGLGKSGTAIWCWQQSGLPRALIVCPKTVKKNWVRELEATLQGVQTFVIDGTASQRASVVGYMQHWLHEGNERGDRAAAIINYDLLHLLPDNQAEALKEWIEGQFLILDESHYIKSRKARRTKFVHEHLAPADGGALYRLCLSGTPVRNTLEDLWSQVQIVRPGTWSSFHQFDKFHLIRSNLEIDTGKVKRDGTKLTKTINIVRQSKNVDQLNAVVNTMQVRRKKEDVLDLPPKIFTFPEFSLEPATAKVYKMMKEFALMELAELGEDTPIFAPQAKSALEVTLRLEQLAQGCLGGIPERYLEQVTPLLKSAVKVKGRPGQLVFPKSAKLMWLKETIDTIIGQGGRPFILSRFNLPMFWLVDQWEDAAMMHGGMSMTDRDDTIEKFQRNGISALFCQVKIAEGFNLTASQDVIFLGRDWSPAINKQGTDRCHRIGQTGTVNVQVPIVTGTFEQYLHKKLAAKDADAQQALKTITIGELRNAL